MAHREYEDRALGPAVPVPDIPPYRTWDVTLRQGSWSETLEIVAHEIEMAPDYSVIRWREFFKDAQGLPGNRVLLVLVKAQDGWLKISERPIIDSSSGLISLQ
jgi:hypothetical protein